ncbi:MAG: tryptophan-rich sensory protein [Christensenellales bacterium]
MKTKTRAWIHLIALFITLGVNALGATGQINGLSQKVVSDRYNTLVTPGPASFSIWGVIYTLLLISLIYMIVKHQDAGVGRIVDAISLPFLLSCAANILWIVTFSYEWIGVSTLLIFAFVVCLALLNLRLKAVKGPGRSLFALTFGVYNGWLTIASVVNLSAFLVQQGWNGFGLSAAAWALIILIAALAIAAGIQYRLRSAAFTLPLAWAYFGIWQRQTAQGEFSFAGQYPAVITVSLVGCAVLLILAVVMFWRNGFSLLPKDAK